VIPLTESACANLSFDFTGHMGRSAPEKPAQRPRPVSGSDLVRKEKFMSFVTMQPEALTPAADEVSAFTAAQLPAHAQLYQAVSAQATAIHDMFVSTLGTSAGSYAATEAANAVAAS
jgi:hypothetical protein